MKTLASTVLAALFIILPFSASALTVDYGSSAGGSTGSDGTAASGVMQVKTDVGGDTRVDTKIEAEVETETSKGMTSTARSETMIGVDKETSPTEDGDDADFSVFAESVKKTHEQVADIDVDADGAVDVAFKHEGWFLGFIPVTVTSHTTVEAASDGSAKAHVRLPWWSFLVSGVKTAQSEAEASLNANADVKADASTQTTMASRVKLVDVMVSSLKEADLKMKASYDLKANKKI